MDCSPPGSSVHEISQARILEWVPFPISRGIFPTQGWNPCLLHSQADSLPLSHQRSLDMCFQMKAFTSVDSFPSSGLHLHFVHICIIVLSWLVMDLFLICLLFDIHYDRAHAFSAFLPQILSERKGERVGTACWVLRLVVFRGGQYIL